MSFLAASAGVGVHHGVCHLLLLAVRDCGNTGGRLGGTRLQEASFVPLDVALKRRTLRTNDLPCAILALRKPAAEAASPSVILCFIVDGFELHSQACNVSYSALYLARRD